MREVEANEIVRGVWKCKNKTNKVVREWENATEAKKTSCGSAEDAKEANKVVWEVTNKPTKSCGM